MATSSVLHEHIRPEFKSLQSWLASFRCHLKMLFPTFRAVNGSNPRHIKGWISICESLYTPVGQCGAKSPRPKQVRDGENMFHSWGSSHGAALQRRSSKPRVWPASGNIAMPCLLRRPFHQKSHSQISCLFICKSFPALTSPSLKNSTTSKAELWPQKGRCANKSVKSSWVFVIAIDFSNVKDRQAS